MSVHYGPHPLDLDGEEHAKELGRKAGRLNWKFDTNPYPYASPLWDAWNDGYFKTSTRRRPLGDHKRPPLSEEERAVFQDRPEYESGRHCVECGEPISKRAPIAFDGGTYELCRRCLE